MSIDIARPQIGRIYDYVLGGSYNYEADRRAADAILDLVPAYPRWAKLNRAFLGHVGQRWAAEGRKDVLDLGSGLPTQGHFNEHLPGARILFADSDPLTVVQGRQLLAYSPDMAYVEADVRQTEALLDEAAAYFGEARHLAVGCIGILYFLSDEELGNLARRLHAFCAPGSAMALTFHVIPDEPGAEAVREALFESAKLARINFFIRTPERIGELIAPWRMLSARPLVDIIGDVAPLPVRPEHPMHRARILGAFAEY
jgi:hypothetical protein